MGNNLRHSYENDWLNMLDSVEFNFKCQQRCRPFLPSKYRVFSRENKWLNYAQVFNEVLPALTTRENVCQKCRDDDPLSEYGQRILGLLRTLHLLLLRNGNQPIGPKRYQEYKQQE